MLLEILERIRKPAAAVLLSWAILLNLRFFVSAGPLWRDEANSVQQACLPGWNSVVDSLQYDSFPVLYPAVLRVWTSIPLLAGDPALRVMGLLTGLALLISICLVCRLFGSRLPVVALVLAGADPVLVSEACSIRPYGLTLVALLWAFAAHGMCLMRYSRRWLLVASIASIFAVQLSYSSAFFIAAFGLMAAGLALRQRERQLALSVLIPGIVAALTLLPYLPAIQRARSWVVLLHYRVDWMQFCASYAKEHTPVLPLIWIMFLALACITVFLRRQRGSSSPPGPASARYAAGVAALALVSQVAFVELMKVPPFPRYFLPVLLFIAIALQLLFDRAPRTSHVVLAVMALLLIAWPAWSWLGLRRTNMDRVARVLGREARAEDLIILSPWFLHPSFQRYYTGPAGWITVPELPASPITRYDLFMKAMFRNVSAGDLAARITNTLARGGRLWLVCQEIGYVPDAGHQPEAPSPPSRVSGDDYVRYRSYWEREVWFLLRSCCRSQQLSVSASPRVWVEERLLLALWSPGHRESEDRLKIQIK